MKNRIMVLGGYGNFGKRISRALANKNVEVLIVGRNLKKAKALATEIGSGAKALSFNVPDGLAQAFQTHRPDAVVNTVGPFQQQNYKVARTAILNQVHYIDLADGRDFVCGITELDEIAKSNGVAVISGASTVPALSDAVLAEYSEEFLSIDQMKFGISPGQGAERGLATTQSILSYVGKPLAPFPSIKTRMYGWQDLYRQSYPNLGKRWMANCEIPDLDLLPQRYDIKSIHFSAGLELSLLHIGLWAAGWLVRFGLPVPLAKLAAPLLGISNWFNRFGSSNGGMHIILTGKSADHPDKKLERRWFIVARDGHGPHIPTIPAIVLSHRITKGDLPAAGAYPCLGLVSLAEYLEELQGKNINSVSERR